MGGRGAASGISDKGKVYGSEYTSLLTVGNIKFVKYNDSTSAKAPQETMTQGRVYVTVNNKNKLTTITYYDNNGKRTKSIDLNHAHDRKKPHTHYGYEHSEYGTTGLTTKERNLVDFVYKAWYNNYGKQQCRVSTC